MDRLEDRRIIFVAQMVVYGGIERNIIGLAEYLNLQGIPYVIMCFYSDIDLSHYAGWHVNVEQLTRSNNQYVKAFLLQRALRHSNYMPLLFGIKGAFNMGMFYARSCILHFTDPPSLLTGKPLSSFQFVAKLRAIVAHHYTRVGTKRAYKVVTMTEKNRAELEAVYHVDSLVLPQGGRPAPVPIKYRKLSSVITLLSVSRIERSKRVDWIINALANLQDTELNLRLVVVGKGDELINLKELVATLQMNAYVNFCGEVTDMELEQHFSDADVFVMPAVQGYGLPALEALYRKTPVLLHKDSGVSEVLAGHEWAEVFTGGVPELTEALKRLINRLKTSNMDESQLHSLPTERDWAYKLSNICGWI